MIHILANLPKNYKTTVEMAEKDLLAGALTMEGLRDLHQVRYEQTELSSNDDIMLFIKQFKGSCRICGKI